MIKHRLSACEMNKKYDIEEWSPKQVDVKEYPMPKEKEVNKDFVGRILSPGDYVLFSQKYFVPYEYGIIEEETNWPFNGSVIVRKLKSSRKGKFKNRFPIQTQKLIKISKEDLMIKMLEDGISSF